MFFLFVWAILIPALLTAHLNHFIYLQTEGKQPFYAKLDKKILSSSPSGYLIIPKLKDGTYNITIGFPKYENSEQYYVCSINNKDAGYLVKNFGEKGWGLFNLQTLEVVMAGNKIKDPEAVKSEKTDEFSSMLSEVVNDPSIKQAEKPANPEKEKTAVVKQTEKQSVPQQSKSLIQKKQSMSSKAGVDAVYIDITADKPDTIKIFIPFDTDVSAVKNILHTSPVQEPPVSNGVEGSKEVKVQESRSNQVKEETNSVEQESVETKKETFKEDKKFLPIEMQTAAKQETKVLASSPPAMVNSDCKAHAGEEDFLKLRKKMAAEDADDGMITVAQKFFKAKCYTTDQIKNLSVLFLQDAGKYRFFDLAYPFVSDSHNFGTLESLLIDTYYISRFKAMVRH